MKKGTFCSSDHVPCVRPCSELATCCRCDGREQLVAAHTQQQRSWKLAIDVDDRFFFFNVGSGGKLAAELNNFP